MKYLVIFFFVFGVLSSKAQETLKPVNVDADSVQLETERNLLYRQLVSGASPLGESMEMEPLKLPVFDFNAEIVKRWSFDGSGLAYSYGNPWMHFFPGIGYSPFLRNEAVFSGASYKLGEKFTLGGYSFGANTVFTAPLPNQGVNRFDTRGSTFFMQYKVSKNFKIETRVSVSQGPGY